MNGPKDPFDDAELLRFLIGDPEEEPVVEEHGRVPPPGTPYVRRRACPCPLCREAARPRRDEEPR